MASTFILTAIGAPWLGALVVWLLGDRRARGQHIVAAAAALVGAGSALSLLPRAIWQATTDAAVRLPFGPFVGDLTFVADGLAVYLAVIATLIGALVVIFSAGYMRGASQLGRYYALVLLFIGAMCGLVFSGNLLFLFLFWEITAFCSYALISFHNDDPQAVAAGIKALIITQVGGVGLLLGILLAVAYLPDLQVSTLLGAAGSFPAGALAVVAFGFLLAAMAKSAQVPLHIWLPDAMAAPTPVSALIHAATMVNAGVYLLARFYPAFAGVAGWTTAVVVAGLASVLVGGLMAATCDDLKRVLAYSTVSQLGFMVTGVGLGAIFESQFYLFNHAIFKALLFLGAGAIIHELGTRDMLQMGGLWQRMRRVAVPFLIGAMGLMGLPVVNGFWAKEILLETALHHSPAVVYPVLVLGAALTAYYVARMCWLVFFRQGQSPATNHGRVSWFMVGPLVVLAVAVLIIWPVAGPLATWLRATLPFHAPYLLPEWPVAELISWQTVLSPSTAIVLGATLAGALLWWARRGVGAGELPGSVGIGRAEGLFDRAATSISTVTRGTAALLQQTQTGQLNWNIAGVVLLAIAMLLLVGLGVL